MRIAMVASEANPFCKSGGLADVLFSLSRELVKEGHKVCVILPFYKSIKDINIIRFQRVSRCDINLSWRKQEAEFYRYEDRAGIIFYFIGNHYYFDRENLYGYVDDGERFAFFSLAALHLLNELNESPDIIHVHDHQAAMIPCLLKEKPFNYPRLSCSKTVLTIHNPAFKGYLDDHALMELFELPHSLYEEGKVRFDGAVSTLKSGIIYSDKITTVSPNHRDELLAPETSMGLSTVLELRREDFVGIVNGIDTEEFNPSRDTYLIANYGVDDYEVGKAANRARLLEKSGIIENGGPAFGLVSRLTSQKGIDLVIGACEHIINHGGLVFILGSGDAYYENELQRIRDRHPQSFSFYRGFSNQVAHDIYASCDFFLMPSNFEPCGIGQLIALRYGTLPIARSTGGLKDTIVEKGAKADGFLFNDYDLNGFLWAIGEAEKVYKKKKATFKKMIANAMKADHSWHASCLQYEALYKALVH